MLLKLPRKRSIASVTPAGFWATTRLLKFDDFADRFVLDQSQRLGRDRCFGLLFVCFKQVFRTHKAADVVVAGRQRENNRHGKCIVYVFIIATIDGVATQPLIATAQAF